MVTHSTTVNKELLMLLCGTSPQMLDHHEMSLASQTKQPRAEAGSKQVYTQASLIITADIF